MSAPLESKVLHSSWSQISHWTRGWLLKWKGGLRKPQGAFGPPLKVNTASQLLSAIPRSKNSENWQFLNNSFGSRTNPTSSGGKMWPELRKIICSLFLPLHVNVLTFHCWNNGLDYGMLSSLWGCYMYVPYYLSKKFWTFKTHLAPRVSDKGKSL